jgi:hypothetical protein
MREFEKENTVVGLPWSVGWLNSVKHIETPSDEISLNLLPSSNGQAVAMRTNSAPLTASEATRKLWKMPNTTLSKTPH